ncbi:unnamed protein product [Pelagomonas calceolata]|uniref:Uncharacterized protein n=1 Tax=Pelagomonas calceolata TaxID=35677 RepID=A0A8J2SYX4_9STRA|nr:unnamed protein product [Pelagomonas calceolata]
MPAALTPQRRNPFKVVAGDLGHLATTVVKLGLRVPRATAGGVQQLVGSINDARKRRAAAAYVDACLEEAPQPPPQPQPVAVIKPPTQPLRGLSPVAMRAVKAGRANVAQRTPPGLSASSLPVTPMDAAMGSRARASGVPATPVAYAPAVSGRPPSVMDAALGARQAIPINPSTRVSASSTAPSVLDAALGSRDRAAVVKPVTSVSKTAGARENYAEAALKQMQQRASAMDEVAARRRAHERDAAAAWTRQRERDVTAAQRAQAATRAAAAPTVIVDRVQAPRRDPPLVDRRTVPRGGAFAPTQQYAAPAAAPAVVDAAPAAAAVAEEPVAAPLVRKTPIGADLFTQLGGAFLVLLAVMAAPSFSGQMACVAASVVGYQLRALQAFFGPSN